MSLRESLRDTGKRLHQAVAGCLFARADTLLREHRRCLDALPADAPDREEILREAAELVESVRRMTLATRAAAGAQLKALPATLMPYRAPRTTARHSWEMTA